MIKNAISIIIILTTISCNNKNKEIMKKEEVKSIFEIGESAPAEYFTGNVKAKALLVDDQYFQCNIYNVIFEKNARTNWHSHPSGQILLVVEGEGSYQLKGEAVQTMKKGDVISFKPNIEHWHGASSKSAMTHIAINPNTEKGLVKWLQKVTDEEFKNIKLE
jgi:quercetin dioxygenase-like cupin family protein